MQQVFQAEARNLVNLLQGRADFLFACVVHARLEPRQDRLLLVQPRANHERKSEFVAVSLIQFLEARNLIGTEAIQPCTGLLRRGFPRQRSGQGGATHQIGMRLNQGNLFFLGCSLDRLAKLSIERVRVREGSPCPCRLGDPGRVFKDRLEDAHKLLARERVDLLQRKSSFVHGHGRFITPDMATGKLIHQHYGKARVRLLKLFRHGQRHDIKEVEVSIELEGDFAAAYVHGDNRLVVPTDTMKNTVQALAHEHLAAQLEPFTATVARHFLLRYPQVTQAKVEVAAVDWRPLQVDGRPHEHSFLAGAGARCFARVAALREKMRIESGIENVRILKSTGSGFAGFPRDEFTTLAETQDRILATRLTSTWLFERAPADYTAANDSILAAMLKVFATQYSPSVQATLYQMADAALDAVPEIAEVTLAMPNLHCLPINLKPFGKENRNELFTPTDEPHGVIEATVARK